MAYILAYSAGAGFGFAPFYVIVAILFAIWGYRAGSVRSVGAIGGLLLGFFLGFIGIIIVYITPRR